MIGLARVGNLIIERAAKEIRENSDHVKAKIREQWDVKSREFLDYWFAEETQLELAALVSEIEKVEDAKLRAFFNLTLSATIITKSGGVSLSRDLAHTRPHRVKVLLSKEGEVLFGKAFSEDASNHRLRHQTKILRSPFEEFEKSFKRNLKYLEPRDSGIDMDSQIQKRMHKEYVICFTKFQQDKILISALGGNYIVKPDIIVARIPLKDEEINQCEPVLKEEDALAIHTPLRLANHVDKVLPILHASISCKWTTRNDMVQNTRTEALNLIRNRKGHLPHVVVVTAEPLPMRIAALALGTGDMDCIYHIALHELKQAVVECDNEDQLEMLNLMVDGRRLRDISNLPFDLSA